MTDSNQFSKLFLNTNSLISKELHNLVHKIQTSIIIELPGSLKPKPFNN
jgi:hypothetical protein